MDLTDYAPTPDLTRARTLSARWYIDPQLLDLEKPRIFWRTWQPGGRASGGARPGDYLACDVLGEPVLVTRAKMARSALSGTSAGMAVARV